MYQIIDNRLIKTDMSTFDSLKTAVFIHKELSIIEKAYFADYFEDVHERVKYCKAQEHYTYMSGTIVLPVKEHFPQTKWFSFCIKKDMLLLIDDDGLVDQYMHRLTNVKFYTQSSPGRILADIIELSIEHDFDYLESIEEQITGIEDMVLNNTIKDFNRKMTKIKRESMYYYNFYNQMADMLEGLIDDINDRFAVNDKQYFDAILHRCLRLQNYARQLREFSTQVNEEYQMQLDLYLNNVMKILTVVTAVLMPLTLITSWYGMNFKNMPELSWRYGYLMVSVIMIIVLIGSLWLMRRKKFW